MTKTPSSYYTIRFGDCDLFGHLNNARYIDYFMNAREDHLKEAYNITLDSFYKEGISWLVSHHEILYLKPAAYNETVLITSYLIKATDDKLIVEMQMQSEQKNQLKALLRTTFVPINVSTGRKDKHSNSFMDFANSILLTEDLQPAPLTETASILLGEQKAKSQ